MSRHHHPAHTRKGSALAVGTADNCERTVGRRMDAVNEALEWLEVKCGEVGGLAQSSKDSGKSTVLSKQTRVADKGFSSLLGHRLPSHALNGRRD